MPYNKGSYQQIFAALIIYTYVDIPEINVAQILQHINTLSRFFESTFHFVDRALQIQIQTYVLDLVFGYKSKGEDN